MSEPKQEFCSPCCGTPVTPLDQEEIVRTSYSTEYYRDKCDKCGALCWPLLYKLWDSAGKEFSVGDIMQCPGNRPEYHAVIKDGYGLEIRDLVANNVYMWDPPLVNIGPYWEHLDKVSDEDLEHYWQTTREEAERKLKEEK